ncbi:MAG: hypothetical protein QME77_02320 [bacterium]|nr:hypothetical protein [bacterium]
MRVTIVTTTLTSILIVVVAAVGIAAALSPGDVVAYPVQRVSPLLPFGPSVQIIPQDEYQRQFPNTFARLYGIAMLPSDDPYHRALREAITRLNYHRGLTVQLWPDRAGKVARLHGYVDGKWTDLNALLVREGAAAARAEGKSAPYAADQEAARVARVGRYVYRGALAAFWANSVPLYAATFTPSPGVSLPFAVARVSQTRTEAGYLTQRGVVLLPMSGAKLQYHLVGVLAKGADLSIITRRIGGGGPQTLRWRWDGAAYQVLRR